MKKPYDMYERAENETVLIESATSVLVLAHWKDTYNQELRVSVSRHYWDRDRRYKKANIGEWGGSHFPPSLNEANVRWLIARLTELFDNPEQQRTLIELSPGALKGDNRNVETD